MLNQRKDCCLFLVVEAFVRVCTKQFKIRRKGTKKKRDMQIKSQKLIFFDIIAYETT